MAGDWIPMRLDLREDPAVMAMAEKLKVREEVIVGYLHAVWSWLSRQCHDGTVTGVTLLSLGRVTNLTGFPELMRDEGWLIESRTTEGKPQIAVPNWDRWLSQSAKNRVKAAERQRKARHGFVTEVSRSHRDKSATTGEKRKGEKKKRPPKPPEGEQVRVQIDSVASYYLSIHPRAKVGTRERKLIAERLREGFTVEDLKQAIDGNHKSDYHSGVNDTGKKYHGIGLIFRNAEKVSGFIESAEGADVRRGPSMPTLAQVQEAYGHVEE